MAFFTPDPEPLATDDPERQSPPWWQAPEDELPEIVPAAAVLAVSAHVALALVGAHVYRDGIELRIERRLRRGALAAREWEQLTNRFVEMHFAEDGAAARLQHGLLLADGSRVVERSFGTPGQDPMARPDGYSLMRNGGGGGGGSSTYATSEQLWLWPRPPAGATELVVQWPAMGIPESRHTIDLSGIRELAERSTPLWRE